MIDEEDDDDEEVSDVHKLWDSVDDDFLLFDRIPEAERPCSGSDLCAFVYLDKLFPDDRHRDMVSTAEHDQIWLRITEEQIASLSEADVLYLTRCGVWHDDEVDALSMHV